MAWGNTFSPSEPRFMGNVKTARDMLAVRYSIHILLCINDLSRYVCVCRVSVYVLQIQT